jgi:thioester reductase-like protein
VSDGSVLVTGGAGVVGSALLRELGGELDVVCLVHRTPLPEGCEGADVVTGDVTRPRLGLGRAAYAELAARVSAIVHCAAVVEFNADRHVLHGLNVEGTEQVLALASDAGASLCYTSSAFLARARLLEGEEEGTVGGLREYLRSKQIAEELVRGGGVPYTIVRPPLLFSDSRTGLITREQGLHKVLRGVCAGAVPFLPWAPEARVDFLPQDVVAQVLASLVRAGDADGREYWVTAGAQALTARTIVETCVAGMAAHGVEVPLPPFFDIEMVKRLIVPAFLDAFSEGDRRRLDSLIALATVFGTEEPFPESFGELPDGPPAPTELELLSALELTVERAWAPAGRRLAGVG